jgi:heat shock protein HtpX
MLATNGLYGHIQKNTLKSLLLLVGFVALIVLFWTSWCVIYSAIVDHWWVAQSVSKKAKRPPVTLALIWSTGSARAMAWWWVPLFISTCWFVIAYFCYADIIKASTGAHDVSRREEPRLYNIIENGAIAAGLPMPRVQVMRTSALNAYAAGLSPQDSVVAVTRGLLERLDDRELQAVVAHELTHIKNRDVRLMVVATVFAGGLTLVGQGVANLLSGGASGSADVAVGVTKGAASAASSAETEDLPALIGSIVVGIAFLCLAHLFAILIYFAISRSREFLADAGAVEITKDPDALISALQKISGEDDDMSEINANLRAMMISANADSLFATHPEISERVSALRKHAGGRVPIARSFGRPATKATPWSKNPATAAMASPIGSVGFGRRPARLRPQT